MPMFTRSHDCEYCHNSLFPPHGAAIASLLELSRASCVMYIFFVCGHLRPRLPALGLAL